MSLLVNKAVEGNSVTLQFTITTSFRTSPSALNIKLEKSEISLFFFPFKFYFSHWLLQPYFHSLPALQYCSVFKKKTNNAVSGWVSLLLTHLHSSTWLTHSLAPMLKNADRPVAQAARVTRFVCRLLLNRVHPDLHKHQAPHGTVKVLFSDIRNSLRFDQVNI